MSRIDEALRRSQTVEPPPRQDREAHGEGVHSAWDFQKDRTEVSAPTAGAVLTRRAPVTEALTDGAARILQPPVAEALTDSAAVISDFNSQWKDRLVISPSADWFLVEQFRRLAATLHQAQTNANIKVIMVTSASPGDGKTLTAINLSLILSESYGRKVLLIDADLRRPSIRDVSHMPNVLGLSDGLRAKTEQKLSVMQITKTLTLLPAGRPDPDPMSGLTSSRMRRLLDEAMTRFDWVILDAPPVGTVVDASLLAGMVDASLLVVRAGHTRCPIASKAIEALGRDRILGIVLNGVEQLDTTSYGDYHTAYGPHGPAGR